MEHPDKIEFARLRMAQAQDEFDNYLRSAKYIPERGRELADAVKVARDEYVETLEKLWPKI